MSRRAALQPTTLRTLIACFCAVLASHCGGPPPRVANPARALDERRAIEIIIETFREEGQAPVPGFQVALSSNRALQVDVAADGKRYGVAYVTSAERLELGDSLPPRDPAMGDALQLVTGIGVDANARVVVLYDIDYLYDDHVGEAREKSTVVAELKLRRDVKDFLVLARAERWP